MRMTARVHGAGEPVVLLHGIPGSAGVWDHVVERLAGEHRVVVPDLLGFGSSPGEADIETLWADSQARALAALLDELGIERAALVGHDFGGPVALALTAARPDLATGLVLCATNAFPDTPIPLPIRAVTWPLVGGPAARLLFSGPALRMMLRQGSGPSAREQASVRTIFATALRELEDRYAPIERALRAVSCPSLVVWGDRDPFFGLAQARRTAAALPGARLVILEGAGHFLPSERPGRLAAEIAAFLRDPVPA